MIVIGEKLISSIEIPLKARSVSIFFKMIDFNSVFSTFVDQSGFMHCVETFEVALDRAVSSREENFSDPFQFSAKLPAPLILALSLHLSPISSSLIRHSHHCPFLAPRKPVLRAGAKFSTWTSQGLSRPGWCPMKPSKTRPLTSPTYWTALTRRLRPRSSASSRDSHRGTSASGFEAKPSLFHHPLPCPFLCHVASSRTPGYCSLGRRSRPPCRIPGRNLLEGAA